MARRQRKPVVGKPPVVNDPASAKLFINRELSWLGFNERVLEEAHDPKVPLVERLKFVAIVSSNLDEFFMVRVAGLKQQLSGNVAETPPDGLTAAEQLAAISTRAHAMVANLYAAWRNDIEPGLAQAGIRRVAPGELTPEQKAHLSAYFAREVWPVLTPLAVDPGHPFPMLRNRSLNLAVFMHREKDKTGRRETVVAVVQVPSVLPRITEVPLPPAAPSEGNGVPAAGTTRFAYMLLEDLIAMHVGELFPGFRVLGCSPFRVTRNFDLSIDEDEADDLLKTIQKELRRRERGSAVRLEIAHDTPIEVVVFLRSALRLETDDVYLVEGPLHLADLAPLGARDDMREYRDEPFSPQIVPPLQEYDDIFRVIAQRDILLQHPYESFEDVVEFIAEAADDPNVLAIKQTLYRTSGDSPIVRALIRAAENGKQVTAVVELKARFDEANNIQWARTLEESGVHVVYGLIGLKTHCKVALVVRREGKRIRRYVHLATGNYNPSTARLYTDLSYFTARDAYADDAGALFNLLTGYSSPPSWKRFAVAPLGLHDRIIELIEREAALGDARPHHRQDERAGRRARDQGALPRVAGRRRDRSHRARHLLPAPGRPRGQRQHPRHQHRRSLPRARAHLSLRQRRQARGLPVVGRLDAAQLPAPRRGHVPRRRRGAARSRDRRDSGDRPQGQRQGAAPPVRRPLRSPAGRDGSRRRGGGGQPAQPVPLHGTGAREGPGRAAVARNRRHLSCPADAPGAGWDAAARGRRHRTARGVVVMQATHA